jgi:hypothetical protein
MFVSQYPFLFLPVSLALDQINIITSYTCGMVAFGNNRPRSYLCRTMQYSCIIVGSKRLTDNPTYRVYEQKA